MRAVRAIEETDGALDDAQAVRHAARRWRGRDERVVARARCLGTAIGLELDIARWRAALPWLLVAAAVLVGVLASAIVAAVTGNERSINAVSALLAVLGLPTLSLALWGLGLAWRRPLGGGGISRWMLALAARLPGLRTPHGLRLLRSALDLLAGARLLPWVLGLANHLIWIGAFALLLAGLLWAFAFRAYTLSWETTILSPAFFERVVTVTGWLPARLGLPVPDAAHALAASAPVGDQRPWAWWLIGCTLVYGLAPRLVAAAWCWGVWRVRRTRLLAIDTADPYFRKLSARFERWDETVVRDAEQPAPATNAAQHGSDVVPGRLVVIGFELPDATAWPPPALADPSGWIVRLRGTADERRRTLDRIAQTQPQRLLLVCHAPATPDRGTERFLRGALSWGAQGGLLLVGAAADAPPVRRWQDWLGRVELDRVAVFSDGEAARAWAEGGVHG